MHNKVAEAALELAKDLQERSRNAEKEAAREGMARGLSDAALELSRTVHAATRRKK